MTYCNYCLTKNNMKTCAILMVAFSCLSVGETAFVSSPVNRAPTRDVSHCMKRGNDNLESRRSMLQDVSLATLGIASGFVSQAAHASGGATAGGAYLLSAKQRYNERVTKGVTNFLALGPKLEAGSLEEANTYFSCNDAGCWSDLSAAGYLLANAFRRSASTNPDSLPAVKVRAGPSNNNILY